MPWLPLPFALRPEGCGSTPVLAEIRLEVASALGVSLAELRKDANDKYRFSNSKGERKKRAAAKLTQGSVAPEIEASEDEPVAEDDIEEDGIEEVQFSVRSRRQRQRVDEPADDPIEDWSQPSRNYPVPFPNIAQEDAELRRSDCPARDRRQQHSAACGGCVYAPQCRKKRPGLLLPCAAHGCQRSAHRSCFVTCWECDETHIIYCRSHARDAGCRPL